MACTNNAQTIQARKNKNDEFYTRMVDIENELQHYINHFKDKTILCSCDNPDESNFTLYFKQHFTEYGLKKLISINYNKDSHGVYYLYDGKTEVTTLLEGDGSCLSDEVLDITFQSDIIITNPPFTLFNAYLTLLLSKEKKFIIMGNMNAITNKHIFPYFMDDKVWMGYKGMGGPAIKFRVPKDVYDTHKGKVHYEDETGCYVGVMGVCWYTNLSLDRKERILTLTKQYNPGDYPKYDNFKAINVNKVIDIPYDYTGVIGVPISYLNYHDPARYTILGTTDRNCGIEKELRETDWHDQFGMAYIDGKRIYKRIFIQKNS